MTTISMDTKKASIFLADDHTLFREGLKRLLAGKDNLEVVGEGATAQETIEGVKSLAPDVLILDLSMPGQSGLQVARRLRTLSPSTRTIVVTVHEQEDLVAEAFRAGVRGYVIKDAPVDELLQAIRTVLEGDVYVSPRVARLVSFEAGDPRRVRTMSEKLTAREREVCRYLAQGYTVPEIATMLGISRKTVDVHKTRLMRKLGVHNRADLATYAIRNKLV